MNFIRIDVLVLKDINNSNHVRVDSEGNLCDMVVHKSEVSDFDDIIKAVEARYLEYGAEAHYAVDFDIINQDEICAKLHS